MKLEIGYGADLALAFGEIGVRVGPRTGADARTHEEKEWWCIRRYVFTLSAANQLEFPILITKAERPDFRCTFGSRHVGIEVGEATDPRDQEEMTMFERTQATALWEPLADGSLAAQEILSEHG